eukprot:6980253-Pyramimonas_sp.AAC.1
MAVFFRACQGHSCFAHGIERTRAPYEFGMTQCRGHSLHVTSMEANKESMIDSGVIRYPDKLSGLCRAPDYGLLRLMRREFPAESAEHILHWLRQRRDGDAPP